MKTMSLDSDSRCIGPRPGWERLKMALAARQAKLGAGGLAVFYPLKIPPLKLKRSIVCTSERLSASRLLCISFLSSPNLGSTSSLLRPPGIKGQEQPPCWVAGVGRTRLGSRVLAAGRSVCEHPVPPKESPSRENFWSADRPDFTEAETAATSGQSGELVGI